MAREFYPKGNKISERKYPIIDEITGEVILPVYVIAYKCKKCKLKIVDKFPEGLENWWNGSFKQFLGKEIEAVEVCYLKKSQDPLFEDKTKFEYQFNKNGVAETWNKSKDKRELVKPLRIDKALIKEVVCY